MQRFGNPPRSGVRYIPRPGAYAILPKEGQLLLTFQENPVPELQLPGGGIDPGESPLQALHREVFEETGWSISKPRRMGAFRRFVYMPEYDMWADKVCIIFVAKPVRRIDAPAEEGHVAVWSDPETASQNVGNPGDRYFIKSLFGLT